jgi:hypothetical protein
MAMRTRLKPIAYQDGTTSTESLPLPRVLYPGHYGTFFGFQEAEGAPIYMCSCTYGAIESYLRFRLLRPIPQYSDGRRVFVLDSLTFPSALVESLMNKGIRSGNAVLEHVQFEDKICHECNRQTPSYRYCHEMYGGVFKQTYGWYINKQAYEYGVHPIANTILPEICPQEILDLLEVDPNSFSEYRRQLVEQDPYGAYELDKRFGKQTRWVWRVIENEVRQRFGHKGVGEAWTSETILYYVVRSLLPGRTILRHHRPDFLEGLELDIYIPELRIGIEYQGIQHYKPIQHWGGEEALTKLQERDSRKREICKRLDVKLIYFTYGEDLSQEFVYSRLRSHVKPVRYHSLGCGS